MFLCSIFPFLPAPVIPPEPHVRGGKHFPSSEDAAMLCTACRWLQHNATANYDVLAIAPRQDASKVEQICKHCIAVYAHELDLAAGRYAALEGLAASSLWQDKVAGKYDYIYFPDEDVVQTVTSINKSSAWLIPYALLICHQI